MTGPKNFPSKNRLTKIKKSAPLPPSSSLALRKKKAHAWNKSLKTLKKQIEEDNMDKEAKGKGNLQVLYPPQVAYLHA